MKKQSYIKIVGVFGDIIENLELENSNLRWENENYTEQIDRLTKENNELTAALAAHLEDEGGNNGTKHTNHG